MQEKQDCSVQASLVEFEEHVGRADQPIFMQRIELSGASIFGGLSVRRRARYCDSE